MNLANYMCLECGMCTSTAGAHPKGWKIDEDHLLCTECASKEKYERNYIAIQVEPWSIADDQDMYRVIGHFANHKEAWQDDNRHTNRDEAQTYAEFLMVEFSMGSEANPIAIVHLNDRRQVLLKKDGEWINTFEKVTRSI